MSARTITFPAGGNPCKRIVQQVDSDTDSLRVNVSDEDDSESLDDDENVYEQVFAVQLVAKQIFKCLSYSDLLQMSLVSKSFSGVCREILRERRCCLMRFDTKTPCWSFAKFIDHALKDCVNVPWGGMSIKLSDEMEHECIMRETLYTLIEIVLSRVPIKHITLIRDWPSSNCVFDMCAREFLRDCASNLESLYVNGSPETSCSLSSLFEMEEGDVALPRVEELRFIYEYPYQETQERMVKEAMTACPQLLRLYGAITGECLHQVLLKSNGKIVKELHLTPSVRHLEQLPVFSVDHPTLEKLRFSTHVSTIQKREFSTTNGFPSWTYTARQSFQACFKTIVNKSQHSLTKLAVHHLDLILICRHWNMQTLPNLQHLSLEYDQTIDSREERPTLQRIDWSRFPKLTEVCISCTGAVHEKRDYYLTSFFRSESAQEPSRTVTKICFFQYLVDTNDILNFAVVFPNVKQLLAKQIHPEQLYGLDRIWTLWPDLEELYLDIKPADVNNLDSIFMGIHYEEVDYLLNNVTESFESYHLVPSRPSINYLTKLRKFAVVFPHPETFCLRRRRAGAPDMVFLSDLTAKCGFSRMKRLSVELDRDSCEDMTCRWKLSHLKEYVKFVRWSDPGMMF